MIEEIEEERERERERDRARERERQSERERGGGSLGIPGEIVGNLYSFCEKIQYTVRKEIQISAI